jgi:hypothetical protein
MEVLKKEGIMRKLNRKKRLINFSIIFALTFLTGAALAFASGILDVAGRINLVAPAYVVWTEVYTGDGFAPDSVEPLGTPMGALQEAEIVDYRGRTAQRIVWEMFFYDDEGMAEAMLTAFAENTSTRAAEINVVSVSWYDVEGYAVSSAEMATEFGLSYDFLFDTLSGEILEPGDEGAVMVGVTWDGTVPDYFVGTNRVVNVAQGVDDLFGFVGYIVIEFVYEVAP